MRQTSVSRWISRAVLGLAIAAAQALPAMAVPVKDRVAAQDQVIYFVFTDRFHNGNRQNDMDTNPADPHAYHGGDLQGVIDKLDYIQGLGATTIWISPFNDNQDNAYLGKYWGYHGYWIENFDQVDEHMGDEATLKRLVDEAHMRGMTVLFDAIVNHTGYDAAIVKDPKYDRWFHRNGGVTDWNNPFQNENHDVAGLPDLNTENAEVLAEMTRVWADWVERTGADGFRLDTVRHVPIPFWNVFNGEMKKRFGPEFFILGEVSYHNGRTYPPYLEGANVDALFDFPQFEAMVDVFATGKSCKLLARTLDLDLLYKHPGQMVTFLDSHDEKRFMTVAGGDLNKLRLALMYQLTMRGIPMLYQGIEVGMEGGGDPDNRRDMDFDKNPDMAELTRNLIQLRRSLPALSRGDMRVLSVDDTTIAFSRQHQDQALLVAFNNGATPRTITVPLAADSPLRKASVLHDVVNEGGPQVVDGQVTLTLQPHSAAILSPTSLEESWQ
ncbi:MAG: alpha-amylase family glycosyl hydrolase [Candidatus Sericytochromatia bacterium]